jgi:ferredoxin-like protein FixX
LPPTNGWAPTLRIADFEVDRWVFGRGARSRMVDLLALSCRCRRALADDLRVMARTSRDTGGLIAKLRVLLHDTRASHSTLGQLGVKDRLPYLDTNGAEGPPGVIQLGSGLCIISANFSPDGGTSRYAALLENLAPDRVHPTQAFADCQKRVPREVAETWRWMCPAGVYEIPDDAPETGDVNVIVNYTNCVQCGAITAKGGRLTTPEGGDGPLYQNT